MEPTVTDKFASVACDRQAELALELFASEAAVTVPGTEPLELVFDKVERAKQEWEATVDTLPELVCLVDECGCIIRANRTIEQWQLGQVAQIRGVNLHTLLHPHCSNLFCPLYRTLLQVRNAATGHVETIEIHDVVLGRHLDIVARPVISSKANLPSAAVVVFRDITTQKQNETRQYGGMGIGLALCRAFVEAHGGQLWAESAGEGQGCTFFVALPLDAGPAVSDPCAEA